MDPSDVRVYTVNGTTAGSSSSLPDWLTRKRAGKGKRATREHYEGSIELIQGFEFPEASNRIKTTRNGKNVVATGTYKPQMRVWDLDQLSLKFERHSDSENIDFVVLSDDWTKIAGIHSDRTIELHTQGGLHYKTRIPKLGRSLAYHFPSCDLVVGATGNEVYRMNLDQGRFMTPLTLADENNGEILGVNVVDINPAHQLLAFGVDGNGTVQFWDHRSRTNAGILRLPAGRLLPLNAINSGQALSVTAISSRHDGLSYAIGTSSGHTLLYDIRAANPFALKDQGYGLPIKDVIWLEGGSRMAGDGLVLSADKKVIKVWDRNTPTQNFASITPANDVNNVHHVTDSGLLMTANEGIGMCTYFIPQLGPAPRWASFLENITEEMEDQTTRSVYEDYKFITREELKTLGLDNLVGTPALKPYMHGYFVSLKLYDTARLIANPFAYAEHRERTIKEKMDKMAETRIRAKKDPGVKVNKILAEKILRDEERAKKREERKKKKKATGDDEDEAMAVDEPEADQPQESLLNDPRFSKVFEDPSFAIDVTSREYALLNPSSVAQHKARGKTAVEEEADESDKSSSDGLGGESDEDEGSDSGDSSDEGDLSNFDPRKRPGQRNERLAENLQNSRHARARQPKVSYVPMQASARGSRFEDKDATFGQRLAPKTSKFNSRTHSGGDADDAMEVSWVPSASSKNDDEDNDRPRRKKSDKRGGGVERFGAGLEKGYTEASQDISEAERSGRTHRRHGVRSGSKNTFRRM